jgi:hypothetical protein
MSDYLLDCVNNAGLTVGQTATVYNTPDDPNEWFASRHHDPLDAFGLPYPVECRGVVVEADDRRCAVEADQDDDDDGECDPETNSRR